MAKHLRETIYNRTNGRCAYCGCQLDFNNFHMDHIIPRAEGGKTKDNLVPSCPDCNLCKGKLSLEEFKEKIQGILTKTHQGRIVAKYYGAKPKPIKFFFEELEDGTL